jgi:hypothetical protein
MTVAHDEPAVALGRAEHDNLVIARRIALHTMKAGTRRRTGSRVTTVGSAVPH